MAVTRRTSERDLNTFNQSLRANPEYLAFLRSIGVNTNVAAGQPWRLNDNQRKQAEAWVRRRVGNIDNLQIDPAGNVNQDEGWSKHKKWAIPAAIGAATLGLGAAGIGPAAPLFGGGSSAAGAGSAAASGVIPSASIPGAHLAVPGAIASQGVSATVPTLAATAASAFGPAATTTTAAAGGGANVLRELVPDTIPEYARLAAITVPQFMRPGGGDGIDTEAVNSEIAQTMALQRRRMEQAQPIYDTLVRMAYGMSPMNYRGDAPAGFTPNKPAQGAYQYQAPRFG